MHGRNALLFALLLSLPMSTAQQEPPLLTDATGDVDWAGADVHEISGRTDLVGLTVTEDSETLTFGVLAAAADGGDRPAMDTARYAVHFRNGDQAYLITGLRAQHLMTVVGEEPTASGELYRVDEASGEVRQIMELESAIDGGALRWVVPREVLTDADGLPFLSGQELRDFAAMSFNGQDDLVFWDFVPSVLGILTGDPTVPEDIFPIRDRMPDTGVSPAVFKSAAGSAGKDAILAPAEPLRASNGEETTFLYDVALTNTGANTQTFGLTSSHAPPSWNIWFPVPSVGVAAGETVRVPVAADVPFAHRHGETVTFRITATGDAGASATTEMGVLYPEIAQPAGHHDHVWFHGRHVTTGAAYTPDGEEIELLGEGRYIMNTIQDDPDAVDEPAPQTFDGPFGPGWYVYLDPALQLGIQMDLEATGEVTATLQNDLQEVADAVCNGTLAVVRSDGTAATIATFESAPMAAPTGPVTCQAPLVPSGEARIDPRPGQNLVLYLDMTYDTETPGTTSLIGTRFALIGGEATLPFLEYHDDLDAIEAPPSDIHITVADAEHVVAPGSTVVVPVEVHWAGDAGATLEATLSGPSAAWAELSQQRWRVGPGETALLEIAVAVPADAQDGDRADVVLTIASQDDATQRAFGRIHVRADSGAQLTVQDLEVETETTPGLAPLWCIGGLAWAAGRDQAARAARRTHEPSHPKKSRQKA